MSLTSSLHLMFIRSLRLPGKKTWAEPDLGAKIPRNLSPIKLDIRALRLSATDTNIEHIFLPRWSCLHTQTMTTTIGIPIKLLNEAQVISTAALSCTTSEMANNFIEPCHYPRDHLRPGLPGQAHRRYSRFYSNLTISPTCAANPLGSQNQMLTKLSKF